MDNFTNDLNNRSTRIEYVFCACGEVHYTIIEVQEGCSCGNGRPQDQHGNPIHRVVRPVRN